MKGLNDVTRRTVTRLVLTAAVSLVAGATGLAEHPEGRAAVLENRKAMQEQDRRQNTLPPAPAPAPAADMDSARLREVVAAGWRVARPGLDRAIEDYMPQINPSLPTKVSVYQQQSRLSEKADVSARAEGDNIVLLLTVRGNVLFFKTTQPTPLGRWADPKFSVDYDVQVKVTIPRPVNGQRPRVSSVLVEVSNVKSDSQNAAADVVKAANEVSKFLGGPDFKRRLEQSLSGKRPVMTDTINSLLERTAR
jgi:hypothetical protein